MCTEMKFSKYLELLDDLPPELLKCVERRATEIITQSGLAINTPINDNNDDEIYSENGENPTKRSKKDSAEVMETNDLSSSDDDNEFEAPRKTRKLPKPTKTFIETRNYFASLTPPNDESISQEKSTEDEKAEKIPPLIIRDKSRWEDAVGIFNKNKVKFNGARNVNEGIKVTPASSEDYRSMVKLLDEHNIPKHGFYLDDEKHLKVVIRGIPEDISVEKITEDLNAKNLPPIKVIRMMKRSNKNPEEKIPMPLVLVITKKENRKIYDVTQVCMLDVKVQPKINNSSLGQCHRCQLFGHSQFRCTAPWKCVKCAGSHPTSECPKALNEKPTCANCGGPHTANYRGCPQHIKNRSNQPENIPNKWNSEKPATQLFKPTVPVSTEIAASSISQDKSKSSDKKSSNKFQEVTLILSDMLRSFSSTNPTPEASKTFLINTQKLLNLYFV